MHVHFLVAHPLPQIPTYSHLPGCVKSGSQARTASILRKSKYIIFEFSWVKTKIGDLINILTCYELEHRMQDHCYQSPVKKIVKRVMI